MKKTLKVLKYLILVIVLGLGGLISYALVFLPNIPLQDDVKIETTPERVARGKYLANHVSLCVDCHSKRDWPLYSGPYIEGTEGKGGELFNQDFGFPGKYVSKNITPHKLGAWSDAEIYRAVTSGVSKDGSALFPVMPYTYYQKMDKEDIYSIIAYIRTLVPIEEENVASSSDFPMNIIINTIPSEPDHQTIPKKDNVIAYGGYLVNASGCAECHTKDEKGQIIKELMFSGGRQFKTPFGTMNSPNITSDKKTGIGSWTKEAFVQRFKSNDIASKQPAKIAEGEYNTLMPWTMYGGMTEEDLSAIYDYLMSTKPIENEVVIYED